MKNILKKNQIIISVIAIMLIAAGYMNYTTNTNNAMQTVALTDSEQYAELGDAKLVSSNPAENEVTNILNGEDNKNNTVNSETIQNNEINETISNVEQSSTNTVNNSENIINNETTETNGKNSNTDSSYFTESRLSREKMYSQMIESYQKILDSSQVSDTQKEISQNEIVKINETKNAIMITENLIKNKGFEDVVLFINGNSISIIVKAQELSAEQIAQIQNIVSRELGGEIENIHISCK